MVTRTTLPRWFEQSGPNFQIVIRIYGRMDIYKISLIDHEIKNIVSKLESENPPTLYGRQMLAGLGRQASATVLAG